MGGDGGIPDTQPPLGDSLVPHDLTMITVDPTNQILEVDLDTPATQAYTATAHYLDGAEEDVTAQVTWTTSNLALGTFNGATLEIPPQTTAGAQTTKIGAVLGDVAGLAQLTVVAYRKTGDKTDFFFILPYEDPAGPQQKPLDFNTDVKSLDVFFAMDTTGSMFGEISNLQNSLTNTIIPGIRNQIPDTWFGVGAYEDFPVLPYGALHGSDCGRGGVSTPDQPFHLFQTVTSDAGLVQTAVGRLSNGANAPIGCGQDLPESMIEALYQAATGEGLSSPSPTNVPANHDGVGGVAFRQGSMPVIVPTTDSMSHAPGEGGTCAYSGDAISYAGAVAAVAHARQPTKDALNAICAKVVGIASIEAAIGNCYGLTDEEDFARATGARVPPEAWDVPSRPANCVAGQCCTDLNGVGRAPDGDGLCPLVFKVDANGNGLGPTAVTGLQMLTRYAAFDVTTATEGAATGVNGEPLPPGRTTADFITSIEPDSFQKPAPPPNLPDPTMDAGGFHNVTPGTVVSFQVHAYNDFVEPTEEAQIFRAVIKVLAGGCTDLDQREVLILVPPKPIDIG